MTILCRSNARVAHLVKVPGRFHLQARAQQPVGGTNHPAPTKDKKSKLSPHSSYSGPSPSSCNDPQARGIWVLTSCSSVVVLRLSSSSSLPWAWACRSRASRSRHKG